MMARARVGQNSRQVAKHGTDKASWYAFWKWNGRQRSKTFGPGKEGKRLAMLFAKQIDAKMAAGTYDEKPKVTWSEFRAEVERKVPMEEGTRKCYGVAMDHFERICRPGLLTEITTKTIVDFVAKRSAEPKRLGAGTDCPRVSKATVNRDLRLIKALMRRAKKWGYIDSVPEFEMLRTIERLPTYIPPDHFRAIYQAADSAKFPKLPNISPGTWWRSMLLFAYMTGWRIKEILGIRWEDVNLEAAAVFLRGDAAKGRRDRRIVVHPKAVGCITAMKSDFAISAKVFPWPNHDRTLWSEFQNIQKHAGVIPDRKEHYTFNDIRRAFATMNAPRLPACEFQKRMGHRSLETTMKWYVNPYGWDSKDFDDKVFDPDE